MTQCQIIYDDHLHYLASLVINVFTISNYEALGICRISEINLVNEENLAIEKFTNSTKKGF